MFLAHSVACFVLLSPLQAELMAPPPPPRSESTIPATRSVINPTPSASTSYTPASTAGAPITPGAARSFFLPTPTNKSASSPTGSTVSSIFLKPFTKVFGGNKKSAASETGASEVSNPATRMKGSEAGLSTQDTPKASTTARYKQKDGRFSSAESDVGTPKSQGRPPVPERRATPKTNDNVGLSTINGPRIPPRSSWAESDADADPHSNDRYEERYAESTTAGSRYNGPSPRRPAYTNSEAGASGYSDAPPSEFSEVAPSEFSGVASSTFDPKAHSRALQKMQRNANSLGSVPVSDDQMPT
jgi:hypothetical protein